MATASKLAKRKLLDAQGYPSPNFTALVVGTPTYAADYRYAMNYANYMFGKSELKQYALEWAELNLSKDIFDSLKTIPEHAFVAIGKPCWVELCGGELSAETRAYLNRGIARIVSGDTVASPEDSEEQPTVPVRKKSQEEIRTKATSSLIADIEGALDDQSYVNFMKSFVVPSNVNVDVVRDHFMRQTTELGNVLFGEKDRTGYEGRRRVEITTVYNFLSGIVAKLDAAQEAKKPTTKQTAVVKQKTSPKIAKTRLEISKACKSAKWLASAPEFGLTTGLAPKQIYGAKKAILFNTKYRRVTVLEQATSTGLIIRGTTVDGFDESKSFTQIIRKPTEFFGSGMPFDTLKTERTAATGRLNEFTVIVKVF